MTADDQSRYVEAALAVQGIVLPPAARDAVLVQFARLVAVAAPLQALDLPPEVELAPVFRP
jgi:hypothetical protein